MTPSHDTQERERCPTCFQKRWLSCPDPFHSPDTQPEQRCPTCGSTNPALCAGMTNCQHPFHIPDTQPEQAREDHPQRPGGYRMGPPLSGAAPAQPEQAVDGNGVSFEAEVCPECGAQQVGEGHFDPDTGHADWYCEVCDADFSEPKIVPLIPAHTAQARIENLLSGIKGRNHTIDELTARAEAAEKDRDDWMHEAEKRAHLLGRAETAEAQLAEARAEVDRLRGAMEQIRAHLDETDYVDPHELDLIVSAALTSTEEGE